MVVQYIDKAADEQGCPATTIDVIKCIARSFHLQLWNLQSLAALGDCSGMGSDTDAHSPEPTQFIHCCEDLFVVCSLRVKNGIGIVEDYKHFRRRKEGSQECHVLRVFDPCTDGLGEMGEEMGA